MTAKLFSLSPAGGEGWGEGEKDLAPLTLPLVSPLEGEREFLEQVFNLYQRRLKPGAISRCRGLGLSAKTLPDTTDLSS